ncbi:DUF6192 family protein [Streptomyces sp. NPDC048606]|uniref:DUF6192 family protein n=1 Tax=Streptomyces sp. NPDC048606 TaxID=3154726 RepID=UPI003440C639
MANQLIKDLGEIASNLPDDVAQVRQENRVRAVEELTRDEHVAATVTTGLLRRPAVAFKTMSDDYPDYGLAAT